MSFALMIDDFRESKYGRARAAGDDPPYRYISRLAAIGHPSRRS